MILLFASLLLWAACTAVNNEIEEAPDTKIFLATCTAANTIDLEAFKDHSS